MYKMTMTSHKYYLRRKSLYLLQIISHYVILCLLVGESNAGQFFKVQPGDTTVLDGESFTLYCRVGNKTGVTYWDKDNLTFAVPGDGQNTASDRWAVFGDLDMGEYNLQILQSQQTDAGTYMCKSTSANPGENEISSSPADVTVMEVPDGPSPICLTSKTGNLAEGDPVDFTCAYVPSDGLNNMTSVTWERSGPRVIQNALPLSGPIGREGYVVKKMTVTITISDHLASYKCTVREFSGEKTSTCSTGSLLVQHSPIVELTPVSIHTEEGGNANFTCNLISAYPTDITYAWYYLGRVVQPGGNKLIFGNITNGRTLQVLDLSGNDDGALVTCIVRNSIGTGTSTSIITLSERPFDLERDILIWLIPLGAILLFLMLVIFLAICVLDCRLLAKCCDKRKHNVQGPKVRTWSVANLAMTMRGSGPVDLDDEYFIARSIRSRDNAGIRPDKNTVDRKKPLPEDHMINPNFILEKEGTRHDSTEREKQRKTRSERDRLRNRGTENDYEDDMLDVGKDRSLARVRKQDSENADSGLEGMSSSKESNNSPTLKRMNNNVKSKKALYAEVERINLGLNK